MATYAQSRILQTDDSVNNYQDTNTLLNTLSVNSIFFAIFVVVFEFNRHIKPIYLKRLNKKFIKSGRVPPAPAKYPLGWIVAISAIEDDEILRMVGLDGYMLLRYILLCFRFSMFVTFWGLVVLTPIYKQAGTYVGWNQFTLANIPDDPSSKEIWTTAVFAYVFSAYFCYLLFAEYKNFVKRRMDYLVNGDLDTPPQTYYTILIEKIPTALRSEPKLREFFEKIFPNQVYSVEIALDLNELDDLVTERHTARDKLEKSIALQYATGYRPTTWVVKDDPVLQSSSLSTSQHAPKKSEIASFFGYTVVDSIEYFTLQLSYLNESVTKLQEQYVHQRQMHDQNTATNNSLSLPSGRIEISARHAMSKVKEKVVESHPGFLSSVVNVFRSDRSGHPSANELRNLDESKHLSLIDNDRLGEMRMDGPSSEDHVETGYQNSSTDHAEYDHDSGYNRQSSVSSAQSHDSSINDEKRGSINAGNHSVMELGSKFVNVAGSGVAKGVENIAMEGYKTAQIATKGALRGVLEATRAFELLTVGAYYSTSSTGFITFNSRVAASCASQMLLSQRYYLIQIKSAPNPKDIIWDNVSIPQQQINIRHRIADNTLIVGALFWSFVVGFITTIANLDSLSQQYTWIQVYSNTTFYKFLNSYLAVGILLILLSLLPLIFDIIARNYEGLKLESEIQNSILSRYFYYQLANVFVSVGLGSLASSLHQILDQPSSILSILGNSLPNLSIYFTNLLIVKIFTAIPIEMLRIWPLIQVLSVKTCLDKKKCTRRELKAGAFADPPMLYGWTYPSIMMVLMILSTYCCIAPLLVPFCLVYFGFVFLMYKYQLLYVYITDYQSGGYMWYAVFSRSLVCLCCGMVTLICYLGIRQTFLTGPFYMLLPLPFLIIWFMKSIDAKFRTPSEKLSLESSIDLDRASNIRLKDKRPTAHSTFQQTMFRQPSLAEDRVSPSPYRKNHNNSHGEGEEDVYSPLQDPRADEDIEKAESGWDLTEDPGSPLPDSRSAKYVEPVKDPSPVRYPGPESQQVIFNRRSLLKTSKHESFIEDYIDHYDVLQEVEKEKANEDDGEIDQMLGTSSQTPSKKNSKLIGRRSVTSPQIDTMSSANKLMRADGGGIHVTSPQTLNTGTKSSGNKASTESSPLNEASLRYLF